MLDHLSEKSLPDGTVTGLADALRAGRLSSVELTTHYLDRIRRLDGALNAFITVCGEEALAAARDADERLRRGDASPLTGIPWACKDVFCTSGVRTTCGSKMLADFIAPYESTTTARLAAAGMVLLGKTNMDEFAMGSSNENSFFGGGSSGGSAAAVAAGLAPLATGTDTGGSIRQPASFCGVVGIKPTYGRVSRYGMIAFASSLDQGGAFARNVEDCALLLGQMAGFDPRDSTSAERAEDWLTALQAGVLPAATGPLRIGLPVESFQGLRSDAGAIMDATRQVLEKQGHSVREVSLPHTAVAIPAYYVLSGAEASANLSRYDGIRFGHRADGAGDIRSKASAPRSSAASLPVPTRCRWATTRRTTRRPSACDGSSTRISSPPSATSTCC